MGVLTITTPIDLGPRIGLIGDAHGNHLFLQEAAIQLADRGCTSLVQLGDFGLVWDRSSQQSLAQQKVHEVLELVGLTMHVVLGNHENYDEIELMNAARSPCRATSENHGQDRPPRRDASGLCFCCSHARARK